MCNSEPDPDRTGFRKNSTAADMDIQTTLITAGLNQMFVYLHRCQAKFLTCEISNFTPCAHAQSHILVMKYAEKTEDYGLGFNV